MRTIQPAPIRAASARATSRSTSRPSRQVKKDRWKEARRIAETGKDPLPAKVIQWLDLTRPGPGRDFKEMSDFLKANPDWPLRYTLTQQAERAMPEYLKPQDILKWFGEREPSTVDGAIKLAGALIGTRQEKRAEQVIHRAWIELDFAKDDEQVFLQRFGHLLHSQQHWARLDRLLWDGERDQALRMLGKVDAGRQALAEARLKLSREAKDAQAAVNAVPAGAAQGSGPDLRARAPAAPPGPVQRGGRPARPAAAGRAAARPDVGRAQEGLPRHARRGQRLRRLPPGRRARHEQRREPSPRASSWPAGSRCASSTTRRPR